MEGNQNNHQQKKATNEPLQELSEPAVRNLVGFFDVLIQMDFAQKQKQRNERSEEDGKGLPDNPSIPTEAD
ncbi:MAG: hypothetical protein U0520_03180 [Candidatus Saccharimonadales bacterium]